MKQEFIIGSRGSKLALAQTGWVKAQMERLNPHLKFSIEIVHTRGDKITDVALFRAGGKGLFTKELEAALQERRIDLAVHSLKDLPTELPPDLTIGAIPEREDPHDLLIGEGLQQSLRQLPAGAKIGTSSLRRKAQILAIRPDVEVLDLRGNLDTRLKKLKTAGLNAIIVARAGMNRLGVSQDSAFVGSGTATYAIPYEEMLPAVGQGALAVEIRKSDKTVEALVSAIDHLSTRQAVEAERSLMLELQGGCQVPIGAIAQVSTLKAGASDRLELEAVICSLDGRKIIRDSNSGPVTRAREIGIELAQRLLKSGGQQILDEIPRLALEQPPGPH